MIAGIETIHPKKLVGTKLIMSFYDDRTFDLWRGFMPRRKEISDVEGTDLFSLQLYSPRFFEYFNPEKKFEKWAAVAVSSFNNIPDGMSALEIPGGMYAVFTYHGLPGDASETFRYILQDWIPASGYLPDERYHFEVLGEIIELMSPKSMITPITMYQYQWLTFAGNFIENSRSINFCKTTVNFYFGLCERGD